MMAGAHGMESSSSGTSTTPEASTFVDPRRPTPPPPSPQPFFIHQDQIMWINGPRGHRDPPSRCNQTASLGCFSSQIFYKSPAPSSSSSFWSSQAPSRDHLVFIGQCGVRCPGWVRPGPVRLFSNSGPGESVLRTEGVGVREHAGAGRKGRRSAVDKPLPHAPRTAA